MSTYAEISLNLQKFLAEATLEANTAIDGFTLGLKSGSIAAAEAAQTKFDLLMTLINNNVRRAQQLAETISDPTESNFWRQTSQQYQDYHNNLITKYNNEGLNAALTKAEANSAAWLGETLGDVSGKAGLALQVGMDVYYIANGDWDGLGASSSGLLLSTIAAVAVGSALAGPFSALVVGGLAAIAAIGADWLGRWIWDNIGEQIGGDLGIWIYDKTHPAVSNGQCLIPTARATAVEGSASAHLKVQSPLVLDLDGDGLEFTDLAPGTASFDLDGDGFATKTAWVGPDDGLLVLDRNGDGMINGISELFGNEQAQGFQILGELDTDSDGAISVSDQQYAELRIWQV